MKFSIRDLLLVTVIVALVLGWLVDREQLRREIRAERLRQIGRLQPGLRIAAMPLPTSQAPVPKPAQPMKYSLRSLMIAVLVAPPSATAQLLLLCLAGVAVLAAVWRVGVAARSRS